MRNDRENLIVTLSFDFALDVIAFAEDIKKLNRYEMASQIFRSGTSIGANFRETQNAESKADFIHKFKVAAKEADELMYWLELCRESEFYPTPNDDIINKLKSIQMITSKIISSSKKA